MKLHKLSQYGMLLSYALLMARGASSYFAGTSPARRLARALASGTAR